MNQLFKVSYKDRVIEAEIKQLIGGKFNLLERFKMKGVGSQRFTVEGANRELSDLWKQQTGPQFTNIEMRKEGILLWFRFKIENYVLAFPYSRLNVYKNNNVLTLISGKWTIRLKAANNIPLKMEFVRKLFEKKNEFLPVEQQDYYGDFIESAADQSISLPKIPKRED